tara:strand:- start:869 stop:1018 length:150 start_codon:yes stop_codon:yes gene_type:complete
MVDSETFSWQFLSASLQITSDLSVLVLQPIAVAGKVPRKAWKVVAENRR